MKSSPRTRLAAASALILALIIAVREVRRAHVAQARWAAVDTLIVDARARLVVLKARESGVLLSPTDPSALAPASPAVTGATSAHPPPPRSAERPALSRPWLSRVFAESPKIHALYLEAYRADVELRYAPVFRRLNLTPEEAGQLVGIITKDMALASDIGATARTKDLPSVDPAIRAMNAERKREREEAMRSLLGPVRMVQWEDAAFNQLNLNDTLSQLIARLHVTPNPLTAGQADQLMAVVDPGVLRASSSQLPLLNSATYDGILGQAAQILTLPQFQVFQTFIEAQRARVALHEATRPKKR